MAIYLIDYENTGVKGLYGIEKLKEEDLVIVFYGPKTGAVPFDEHVKISTASSHVEYFKTTKTAKNYLDFQLTTYLGYLVAQTAVRDFRIVSRDSGYDSAVDFWRKRGISVKRQDNVAGEKKAAESRRKKESSQKASSEMANMQVTEQEQPEQTAQETKAEEKKTNTRKRGIRGRGKKETDETAVMEKETVNAAENVQQNAPEHAEVQEEVPSAPMPKSVPESVRKKIRAALKEENLHAGVYRAIYACMLSSVDKQSLNTAFVRQFTQDLGNKYYKAVVPVFTEWRKHS